MAQHRIFCLGSGYVALSLYRSLKHKIIDGTVNLTVIGSENFQCFHGLIPDVLSGHIQPTDVLTASRRHFRGCNFLNAEVQSIDLDSRSVTVEKSLDGKCQIYEYDQLVIALGSTDRLSHVVGLAEHSFKLKKLSSVLALRNQIIETLELANLERDPQARAGLMTFVVAGGGFTGCEIVGMLREYVALLIKNYYSYLDPKDFRVVMVASTDSLLPDLKPRHPWASRYAEKIFREDPHVDLRLGRKLKSVSYDEVILNDGSKIATRTVVTCTGMHAVPVVRSLDVAKDSAERIVTDSFCRVNGHPNIWAGGDCASVPLKDGSIAPALAIWAITQGALIGKNIVRSIESKPLLKYRFTGLGDACTFGHHTAVASLNGLPIKMTGRFAHLVWSLFMLYYLPSKEKRVRVLFDWLVSMVAGPDPLAPKSESPMHISRVLFDEGQIILKQGDTGNSMFFIQEGSVEVLKLQTDGSQHQVAVLGSGERFGEIAVFQNTPRNASIRAISSVKLIQVKRDAAALLAEGGKEL